MKDRPVLVEEHLLLVIKVKYSTSCKNNLCQDLSGGEADKCICSLIGHFN